MKIKTETITFTIWIVVLISRILGSLSNGLISSPLTLFYISSSLLVLWLLYLNIKKGKLLISSSFIFWGIAFAIYLILFGKILVNVRLKKLTSFTFNEMAMFYLLIFSMANYLKDDNKKNLFIKISFWTLSLSVILSAFANWDGNLELIGLISNLFKGYTRERSSFGFYHPNTVSNIALCIIILSAYIVKKDLKIILYILIDVFMVYLIISSASRTALSALLLFIVLIYYHVLTKKIKYKRIMDFGLLVLVLFLFMLSSENSVNSLFEMSNRLNDFLYNIPILIKSGRVFIGLGMIGAGEFYQLPYYNTFYVDNYFLYVLMATGIIGLVFILTFIIFLFKRLVVKSENLPMKRLAFITFLVNIFSSFGETCLIYPSFVSCFVYSVIYIAYACQKQTKFEADR